MDPTDIIFQTVANLTGGIVIDVQTVVVGLVTIGFVVMGVGFIKNLLLSGSEGSVKDEKDESDEKEKKLFSESGSVKKVDI